MNFIIQIENSLIKAYLNEFSTHIENSYKIKKEKEMKYIISYLKDHTNESYAIHKESMNNMLKEWKAHNILYKIGLFRNRTRSVDLNIDNKWYIKLIYAILAFFYI
jgi:hypothetical protein